MNITQIQDLIKFVSKSGVSEVEIEQKDFKIIIKTHEPERKGKVHEVVQMPTAAPIQHMVMPATAPPSAPVAISPKGEVVESKETTIEIKSPMIGTFYRSSTPDKPAFAEVGKEIKAGDVVCVIEAMKLFNEIESEVGGRIVKVLATDSTPVEFDQPLFLIEPV
ncbi:MAG: acetyl-CoA carboxylase biotin carboxyl carrier protein [Flavobacteriales bacterium]|nr:acetyl-CoA carboxylase biotin carboxyl carrier protein [Flavobacteriales bacterium]